MPGVDAGGQSRVGESLPRACGGRGQSPHSRQECGHPAASEKAGFSTREDVRPSVRGGQSALGSQWLRRGPGRGWEWSCQGLPPLTTCQGFYSWYLEDLQHVSIL